MCGLLPTHAAAQTDGGARQRIAAEGIQQTVQQRKPQRQHRHGVDALPGGQGGQRRRVKHAPAHTGLVQPPQILRSTAAGEKAAAHGKMP